MKIENHWLTGEGVIRHPSPNMSGKFRAGQRDTILMHYTAGASAESSVRSMSNPAEKVSAHVVIGRDGMVFQLIPFDKIAWHAGESEYNGRKGYNKYSIGIELDNAGLLTKTENGYQAWFKRYYDPKDVMKAVHRNRSTAEYWHTFTEAQIDKANAICRLLIDHYKLKHILGHEEVSPGRKIDPGPAFPLDVFREKLLHGRRDADEGLEETPHWVKVNTNALNFRSGPGTQHDAVAEPLKRNTSLRVLEKQGHWLRVAVETEGWVHADYVK